MHTFISWLFFYYRLHTLQNKMITACIQVDNNWHTFSDSNCCIFHEKEYYDLLEFIVSHIILAHFVNMFSIYMYFAFDITTKSIKIILYTPFNPNALLHKNPNKYQTKIPFQFSFIINKNIILTVFRLISHPRITDS